MQCIISAMYSACVHDKSIIIILLLVYTMRLCIIKYADAQVTDYNLQLHALVKKQLATKTY